MAALTRQQRDEALADWQEELSRDRERVGGATKADLSTAIDTIDDAIETHWPLLIGLVPARTRSDLGDKLIADLMAKAVKRRAVVAGRIS